MTEDAIQRGLEQDARRIVERIPVADNKCTAIIKRLKETMAEHGLTQAAVGKMVGLRTGSHIIEVLYTAGDAIDNGRIDAGLIAAAINTLNLPISVFLPMQELTAEEPEDQQAIAQAG